MILEEEEKPNENTVKANENNVKAKEKAKEKEKVVKDIKPAGIPKNNIYYRKNNLKTNK